MTTKFFFSDSKWPNIIWTGDCWADSRHTEPKWMNSWAEVEQEAANISEDIGFIVHCVRHESNWDLLNRGALPLERLDE